MPKTPAKAKRLTWRMSASAPKGEWVDTGAPKPPASKLAEPEVTSGSWVTSSFDLLNGTDVVEHPEAMTPEQFDALFKPQKERPKSPSK
jgi:hypothetical protein